MKANPVARSKIRHHRLRAVIVLSILLFGGLVSYWFLFMRDTVESDDAYISGNIIPVQALVPGIVSSVSADNSMHVRTGQLLVSEDRNLTCTKMKREAASLAEAVRSTKSLFAETEGEVAEVDSLKAQKARLLNDLSSYKAAEPSGAVSSLQVSDTKYEISILDRKIEKAQALLRKANALVSGTTISDNPLVLKARAEYVESYIDCHRSSLFSPVNGYVAGRQVQTGEQVKVGQRLMSIVPLDELWVTANLKETKIARIRTGEQVEIRSQAYGRDAVFHGKVIGMDPSGGSTFSLFPPNNATGNYIHIVERVPVRISLSKSELQNHPLRPGMSVTVSIDTRNYSSLHFLATEINTHGRSYATDLYESEMKEAQSAAQQIIQEN
jgi:membrane fusion protein (multidrug efflux system)